VLQTTIFAPLFTKQKATEVMQNKSALWIFTILLALACLYSLSFSSFTSGFEKEAQAEASWKTDSVMQAQGADSVRLDRDSILTRYESKYLRDNREEEVYPVLGFTYEECKAKEMNLGLDLKGGMAVTLEVSIPELIVNLADGSKDSDFRSAIANARQLQLSSDAPFIDLFVQEFEKLNPNPKGLAGIFASRDRDQFPRDAENSIIAEKLTEEAATAVENTERILRTRIDKFGVAQPSIQKQLGGRIVIELPGVKDKQRVRDLLQSTANLEFWETYDNFDIYPKLDDANKRLATLLNPELERDTTTSDFTDAVDGGLTNVDELLEETETDVLIPDSIAADSSELVLDEEGSIFGTEDDSTATDSTNVDGEQSEAEFRKENPLFSVLTPALTSTAGGQYNLAKGAVVGYANVTDTADVNDLLRSKTVIAVLPKDLKLLWGAKPFNGTALPLYAIKVPRGGKAKIDGSVITDASQDFGLDGGVEVVMQMNPAGGNDWKVMTGDNIGQAVAIVLDNMVYSAPIVQSEIAGGRSSISMGSGDLQEQITEADDLANILKAGALPAPARIIDETVVGPTLGTENIQKGFFSFLVALVLVLIYMVLYYARAGFIADIALVANLIFLIGALASMQAALTLPGIAGIVLTIGMAVDANVLIFDRIREELRAGKMVKSAVEFGYSIKGAMSAIIDANITTGITAVILLFFGSGPVKGFATTLGIGILTSLFSAIFITRLLIYRRLESKKDVTFWTASTKNILADPKYNFIGKRKLFYGVSFVLIGIGLFSIFTKGFNLGVDFSGGRAYVVRFVDDVQLEDVRTSLAAQFVEEDGQAASTQVKTYGVSNQLKISTNYLVANTTKDADLMVEGKLKSGLGQLGSDYTIEESRKVDATISDDIKSNALWAVGIALIFIFIYIAVRFNRWQFGLGAIIALIHDVLIVLGLYSLLDGILPFTLEINEAFIAAILTVVGYSINDTVVVFDRVREFLRERKRESQQSVINSAMNATLSRTVNTSFTTFLVLLVIFLFGGVSIQGFVFALLIGVLVGTYSSLFIASNSVIDLVKGMDKSQR
jgi:SecD/SecF fusion protein